jgi:ferredoxin
MSARLIVDWTRCDGHGLCSRLWPERIAVDDWGFPVIRPDPIPEEELRDARRVVGVCPRLALRLEQAR